jgi:DNA-binding transcriptional ArsR family regulator
MARRHSSARAQASAAPVFAALGDATRLQVVARLSSEGPLSIVRLADGFGISRQAVSKHLRVLEDAGLVLGSREGREHLWTLQARRLSDAKGLLDTISSEWDETLERLRVFVED